jgi:hypothetical protein
MNEDLLPVNHMIGHNKADRPLPFVLRNSRAFEVFFGKNCTTQLNLSANGLAAARFNKPRYRAGYLAFLQLPSF